MLCRIPDIRTTQRFCKLSDKKGKQKVLETRKVEDVLADVYRSYQADTIVMELAAHLERAIECADFLDQSHNPTENHNQGKTNEP